MSAPVRVQLRRTKGWRKPDNTVVVARPSKWGNPWIAEPVPNWPRWPGPRPWHVRAPSGGSLTVPLRPAIYECRAEALSVHALAATAYAVEMFRRHTAGHLDLGPIRGKDLACWCPLDQPCHADVLLELANAPERVEA